MSVEEAAHELHVGMADVAKWIVDGRIRARVALGAERPSTQTVLVCAKDVGTWRRSGKVQPRLVPDRRADDFEATGILRRRRPSTGWPPEWEQPGRRKGRASPRRMGVTEADRVKEVRAAVSKLGGRNGWVRLSAVSQGIGNREWVSAGAVRDIVDVLVAEGVLVERLFRPRVGRPSPEVRFADKEVSS